MIINKHTIINIRNKYTIIYDRNRYTIIKWKGVSGCFVYKLHVSLVLHVTENSHNIHRTTGEIIN